MKKIFSICSLAVAALIISAMPILSAEEMMGAPAKDECLLIARNCVDNVITLQQKIDRLNREIARGTDVYTAEELGVLQRKLDDAVQFFDAISAGGGGS